MTDNSLKKKISDLRQSIFNDDDTENVNTQDSSENQKLEEETDKSSTNFFQDIQSINERLEKLESSFYGYAYDTTKVLTSFHQNIKKLNKSLESLSQESSKAFKTVNDLENKLPHVCPLVPRNDGNGRVIIKEPKKIGKITLLAFVALIFLFLAVFFSNIAFEVIYYHLRSLVN